MLCLRILQNYANHNTRRLVVTPSGRARIKLLLNYSLIPQDAERPPAEFCRELTPSSKLLMHLHNLTAALRNHLKDIEFSLNHWQSFSPRQFCRQGRKDSEVLVLQCLKPFKKCVEMVSVASYETIPFKAALIIVRHCCCRCRVQLSFVRSRFLCPFHSARYAVGMIKKMNKVFVSAIVRYVADGSYGLLEFRW